MYYPSHAVETNKENTLTMEDGYVDLDEMVSTYEYTEEQPEEFDDSFFTLIGDAENE